MLVYFFCDGANGVRSLVIRWYILQVASSYMIFLSFSFRLSSFSFSLAAELGMGIGLLGGIVSIYVRVLLISQCCVPEWFGLILSCSTAWLICDLCWWKNWWLVKGILSQNNSFEAYVPSGTFSTVDGTLMLFPMLGVRRMGILVVNMCPLFTYVRVDSTSTF